MSARKITQALTARGIKTKIVQYDRQATPHGIMPGWTIVLEDECQERLAELGADFEPDCETMADVMDWIETLPVLADRLAARASSSGEAGDE